MGVVLWMKEIGQTQWEGSGSQSQRQSVRNLGCFLTSCASRLPKNKKEQAPFGIGTSPQVNVSNSHNDTATEITVMIPPSIILRSTRGPGYRSLLPRSYIFVPPMLTLRWRSDMPRRNSKRHKGAEYRLKDLESSGQTEVRKVIRKEATTDYPRRHTQPTFQANSRDRVNEKSSSYSNSKVEGSGSHTDRTSKSNRNGSYSWGRVPFDSGKLNEDLRKDIADLKVIIEAGDVNSAISQYNLISKDIKAGTPIISSYLMMLGRTAAREKDNRTILDQIQKEAMAIQKDAIKNSVPPSNSTYKRLLAVYRELKCWTEGTKLWRWMTEQDEQILYLSTYAAGIDFFTAKGDSINVAEEIYQEALASSQGSFLQYHLNPNAVLENRESIDTSHFPPDGKNLLSQILRARLQNGDLSGALLLLDTSFRVYGSAEPRAFDVLINKVPSLSDRYTLARLACRSNSVPRGPTLQTLVYALDAEGSNVWRRFSEQKIEMMNASLKLIIAHYDSSGRFDERLIACMLSMADSLVQRAIKESRTTDLARQVADECEKLFESFYPFLTPPATRSHNVLLSIGAGAKYPEFVQRALQKLIDRGGTPDMYTNRAMIIAAATSGDLELVKAAWFELLAMASYSERQLEQNDWNSLFAALMRTDNSVINLAFILEEAERLHYRLESSFEQKVHHFSKGEYDFPLGKDINAENVLSRIQIVFAEVRQILQNIRDNPEYKIDHNSLGMSISSSQTPSASLSDLYTIYDEVSVDPARREQEDYGPIRFEQLDQHPILSQRFHNWATITELLIRNDRAMRAGTKAAAAVEVQDEETGLVIEQPDEYPSSQNHEDIRTLVYKVRGIPFSKNMATSVSLG
jgi:hypothetical protein